MFRFTIRDLLWLMALVGMGFGWLMSDVGWRAIVKNREKNIQQLLKREGEIMVKLAITETDLAELCRIERDRATFNRP